jgi:hypothetical protein
MEMWGKRTPVKGARTMARQKPGQRRFLIAYRTVDGSRGHEVYYDCSSALELFDRLMRLKGQKLESLDIVHLYKPWYRRRQFERDMLMWGFIDGYNSASNRHIDMKRWHDPEYREEIASKCWNMAGN